jgi:hypothetical protein
MTPNIIKLAAALAWGGVAVSSASPASALAIMNQSGAYATCAANYYAQELGHCWQGSGQIDESGIESGYVLYETHYKQQIRFVVSSTCNADGCSTDTSEVYVDAVYSVGRKTVTSQSMCNVKHVYGLGTRAC